MRNIVFLLSFSLLVFASCASSGDKDKPETEQATIDNQHTADSMSAAAEEMQNQQAALDTTEMDTTKAIVDTTKK